MSAISSHLHLQGIIIGILGVSLPQHRMHVIIDGKSVAAESGETILDVAKQEGIDIPTLCRPPDLPHQQLVHSASCLVCLVKLNGRFVPSCATLAEEGMIIDSETDEVTAMRRTALELLLSDHIGHCRTCGEGRKKCRLLKYIAKYKLDRHRFGNSEKTELPLHENGLVFDSRKCIKCGICVAITRQHGEEIGLTFFGRGFETRIGVPFNEPLRQGIGKTAEEIISACPTAAFARQEV